MNEAMIKITDLRKSYGNLDVLKGIDLTIAEREVVVIIGPSGSGKSTLLRCINYLEEPTGGSIVIDSIPLTGEANINEIRKEVGMVFQRFNLFPHMTVLNNLEFTIIFCNCFYRSWDHGILEVIVFSLHQAGFIFVDLAFDFFYYQINGGIHIFGRFLCSQQDPTRRYSNFHNMITFFHFQNC